MSYILEALRKADAERERDPARGIHAQPVRPVQTAPQAGWQRPAAIAAGVALLVAGAGVMLWRPSGDATPAARVTLAPAQSPSPTAQVQPSPVPASGSPAPVPPSAATVLQPPPPPMPAPPPVAAKPAAARVAAAASAPRTAASAAAPASSVAVAAAKPAAAAAPPASAPAERILSMAEAPPEVQRLPISGGVYSENAAQRMLIVAGQVVGEGAEIAPGIVLEQIRPKSAVVRVRGMRVAVPY